MRPTIPRNAAVLVLLATVASGCSVLYPRWHECYQLTSTPLRFAVSVMSAPKEVQGYEVRSSASIAVHEGGGISLYLYSPEGLFKPLEMRRCQRLGAEESETWARTAERLTARLEQRRGEIRDVVYVVGANGEHEGLAAVEDLEPDALEAVKAVACLAVATFGEPGETAFLEASPLLASRLDFPATCPPSDPVRPRATVR